MHTYNEPRLVAALNALPVRERTAFAVACALRLRPYFGYPDKPAIPSEMEAALTALIGNVEGTIPQHAVVAAIATCEARLEIDDALVAAVIYASRVGGTEGSQAAAWAARRAFEARDRHVAEVLHIDFNLEGAEERVLEHDVVQMELEQQSADLLGLAAQTIPALIIVNQAQAATTVRPAIRAPAV